MIRLACLSTLLWLGFGCAGQDPSAATHPPMEGSIAVLDEGRWLGPGLTVQNLTIWPIYSRQERLDVGAILTLAEAEQRGLATVQEGDSAQVERLQVENRSAQPLLICAGTIVKGGKQDRQIACDQLIAANTTQEIEAFCVEQGRWTEAREGEQTQGVFETTDVIASKRVRVSAQYLSDQDAVWSNVARVNAYTDKAPDTHTLLATIDETDREAQENRQQVKLQVRDHFDRLANTSAQGDLVGFAYAINGEPLTARAFASKALFESQFRPYVEAMGIEADTIQQRDRAAGRSPYNKPASRDLLLDMIRQIDAGEDQEESTTGAGRLLIKQTERGGKATCLMQLGDRWIPLTEDWSAPVEYSDAMFEQLAELEALGYTSGE
jgi:hypothetical protein